MTNINESSTKREENYLFKAWSWQWFTSNFIIVLEIIDDIPHLEHGQFDPNHVQHILHIWQRNTVLTWQHLQKRMQIKFYGCFPGRIKMSLYFAFPNWELCLLSLEKSLTSSQACSTFSWNTGFRGILILLFLSNFWFQALFHLK